MADSGPTRKSQRIQRDVLILNEAPKPQDKSTAINNTNTSLPQEDIINIQLSYNPNQPTKKDLWDGNFQTIFLHGSLEHLLSDSKCIKESLTHIAKYIDNKNIDINKSNDIVKLRGIDKAACPFLSAFYNSGWDLLFADENKNYFRQKVSHKFTPKTNPIITEIKREKNIDKLVSIKRLPPPIPAKSHKKIKEISKFFKIIKLAPNNKSERKSYT